MSEVKQSICESQVQPQAQTVEPKAAGVQLKVNPAAIAPAAPQQLHAMQAPQQSPNILPQGSQVSFFSIMHKSLSGSILILTFLLSVANGLILEWGDFH